MPKKSAFLLLVTGYWLLVTDSAHATVDIGQALQLSKGTPVKCSGLDSPGGLLSTILPNVFILSGFILFLYFIFGGFSIITSKGDPEKSAKGKQAITGAIIGFVVIFTSFWIVQIIEILTGVPILNANIPGLSSPACP